MQSSLEAEAKAKAEAIRLNKKMESDIAHLESSLDHANRTNSDIQKHFKELESEFSDLQVRFDDQQRLASKYCEQCTAAERLAGTLRGELDETRHLLEQSDRGRRQYEAELSDARITISSLTAENESFSGIKRKLESELTNLQVSDILCTTYQKYYIGNLKTLPD